MPREGDTFGRYRIEATLGSGGMGEVMRAYDTVLRRRVALKILREDDRDRRVLDTGPSPHDRLMREARAAAELNHPNVVAVYDVGEHEGQSYIAMEHVVGRTLRAFIGDATIPMQARIAWLADAARGLAAAHARGIIHRDVKPENVLVPEGVGAAAKVSDFGTAKKLDFVDADAPTRDGPVSAITVEGRILGTPRFMSPEQLRGEPLDARTDQFSWGVMAYELLSGKDPWSTVSEALGSIALVICHSDPKPLGEVAPDVPPGVQSVVWRAMAKEPARRHASMKEVVAALTGEPTGGDSRARTGVGDDTRPRALRHPGRTPRTWAWIAVGVVTAGVGAAAFGMLYRPGAQVPASAAASTTPARAPAPSSKAAADLEAALQEMHDGSRNGAMEKLARAVEEDGTLGGAMLRFSLQRFDGAPLLARTRYQRAVELRARLDDTELALLDASGPYIRGEETASQWAARLAKAATENPKSTEISYYLGLARFRAYDGAGAVAAFDAALAIDPSFAGAMKGKLDALQLRDGPDDERLWLDTLGRCLALTPLAVDCLRAKIEMLERAGKCAEVEGLVKQWIAARPNAEFPHGELAKAQLGTGRPIETVRETLRQRSLLVGPGMRKRLDASAQASIALATGDLDAAETAAREMLTVVGNERTREPHLEAALALVEIQRELGHDADAARVARSVLARKEAWVEATAPISEAIAGDPTMPLREAEMRGGLLSKSDFDRARHDWIADWQKRARGSAAASLWVRGYAALVATKDEALEALRAQPAYGPIPKAPEPFASGTVSIGQTYLRAGRAAQALPILREAVVATKCTVLFGGLVDVRAHALLAEALEATGERDEACREYAAVLARLGHAARSTTAAAARARSGSLGCTVRDL